MQMQIRCPIDVRADDFLKLNMMSCIMYANADTFSYHVIKDIHFPNFALNLTQLIQAILYSWPLISPDLLLLNAKV